MDFALSAEQQSFAASLHDLLAAANGPAAARAWEPATASPALRSGDRWPTPESQG
jgi:hypothetical protein